MNEPGPKTDSEADYTKLVPTISTVLRLTGVYIVIVGISAVIQDLGTMIARWQLDSADHTGILVDYVSPSFLGDLFYVACGMYLLFGGRWLIENVFLPVKAVQRNIDGDDVESA